MIPTNHLKEESPLDLLKGLSQTSFIFPLFFAIKKKIEEEEIKIIIIIILY